MTKANDRLRAEILETAEDFHKGGILDNAAYARITMISARGRVGGSRTN
jgi:hypothetical protein